MRLEKYELIMRENNRVFEFISKGRKGEILKRIQFIQTRMDGIYNLEFGDVQIDTGYIDDLIISDNGDMLKILATIADAVSTFLNTYSSCLVYAEGSTQSRTRLYQMNINRFFVEISTEFEVYGLRNGGWEKFYRGSNYEAFLVCKGKCNFKHKLHL